MESRTFMQCEGILRGRNQTHLNVLCKLQIAGGCCAFSNYAHDYRGCKSTLIKRVLLGYDVEI